MTQTAASTPPPPELISGVATAYEKGMAALSARQSPAGLIYHYCDANALLSIFQHRQVWATDTNYLNDKDELISLFKNVADYLAGAASAERDFLAGHFKQVATFAVEFRAGLIGLSSCVACFSEDGDVLSQWRAYAADGMGFAIGFDPRELTALTTVGKASLKRMIYGGSIEERIISEYFANFANALAPFKDRLHTFGWPKTSFDQWVQLRIGDFLHELAYECKHPAFHEEREWRIVVDRGELRYRSSANRLIPYRLLDMTSIQDNQLMPIKEIVIGPCAPAMESERVLTYLADAHGYGHSGINFRQSKAPYRK